MTSEMIDRVSKAISDHFEDGLQWSSYEGAAIAAIEAMRDPTPEMLEAGKTPGCSYWEVNGRFNLMLDAALKGNNSE